MSERWFFGEAGQGFGPFSTDQLRQLHAIGLLTPSDVVWKDGSNRSITAADLVAGRTIQSPSRSNNLTVLIAAGAGIIVWAIAWFLGSGLIGKTGSTTSTHPVDQSVALHGPDSEETPLGAEPVANMPEAVVEPVAAAVSDREANANAVVSPQVMSPNAQEDTAYSDARLATDAPSLREEGTAEEGWQSLFDGRTLNGWTYADPTKTGRWTVRDGVLVRLDNGDDASDLLTIRQFENFELEFDFWLGHRANSGVYLRGRFEISLVDMHAVGADGTMPSYACGGIWGQVGPDPAKYDYRGTGNWNAIRIRLVGDHVTVWLNDKEVVSEHQLTSTTQGSLFDTLRGAGPVVLQNHKGAARFKNIRIRQIK